MSGFIVNVVPFLATTISIASMLPQVIKILHSRSARDLSLIRYCLMFRSAFLWSTYFFHLRLWVPFAADSIAIGFACFVLWWKLFKDKR